MRAEIGRVRLPVAQALPKRPSEAVEDGRRWSSGLAEFATSIQMVVVHPSEIDVMELGVRAAVAYCDEWAKARDDWMYREMRMLHPLEYPKGLM